MRDTGHPADCKTCVKERAEAAAAVIPSATAAAAAATVTTTTGAAVVECVTVTAADATTINASTNYSVGGCGGSGFRDCTVCLETLHDANNGSDKQRKMTFIIPCGHVFHTDCYHTWNKTRFLSMSGKRGDGSNGIAGSQKKKMLLQCATCNGPVAASYYVVSDYNCILCRQSIYESQHAVTFTVPDHRLVHTECWLLFNHHRDEQSASSCNNDDDLHPQKQHPSLLTRRWRQSSYSNNSHRHSIFAAKSSSSSAATALVFSFRGQPVTEAHRVFLFAEDTAEKGLASLLAGLVQVLLNNDEGPATTHGKEVALQQLLDMVTVTTNSATSTTPPAITAAALPAVLAAMHASPTRQAAVAAMSRAGIVGAIAETLRQQQHYQQQQQQQRDQLQQQQQQQQLNPNYNVVYLKACLLLALLCSNHAGNCVQAVESRAFARLLFGSSSNDDAAAAAATSIPIDDGERPIGLQVALAVLVHFQQSEANAEPLIVAAGGVEAVLAEMKQRMSDANVQWVGMTFLTELLLAADANTAVRSNNKRHSFSSLRHLLQSHHQQQQHALRRTQTLIQQGELVYNLHAAKIRNGDSTTAAVGEAAEKLLQQLSSIKI